MKIGIEAQRLFRKNKFGIEIVALELIKALQEIDKTNQYYIFTKQDVGHSCLRETDNFKIIVSNKAPYPCWEQFKLPQLCKRYEVDLLHCTSNTAPLWLGVPYVLTLHDVIFLERLTFSGSHYQNYGNLYRRLIAKKVSKNAASIITVSQKEKENICKMMPDYCEKIVVINNGIQDLYLQDTIASYNMDQLHLPENFYLHFANKDPRKNTAFVIKAYSLYIKTGGKIPLVMTNISKSHYQSILQKEKLTDLKNVILLDYISFEAMPSLYKRAFALLFPSLREGFGIPALESLAMGTPVITSKNSPMEENCNDMALYIDPTNTDDLRNKMFVLEENEDYYRTLIKNNKNKMHEFSWKESAKKLLDVYMGVKNNVN